MRPRLGWLKHAFYALATLLLLVCSAEVALKMYDARTGAISGDSPGGESGGVILSEKTHHGLRPASTHVTRHPDTGRLVRWRTNRWGLRGDEIAVPKPPGVYRIICLGDEATLAPETPRSATFCARLEEYLSRSTGRRVEVINAGVPGYCPLLSLLQVRHVVIKLQPDLLILDVHVSDVADDYCYRRLTRLDANSLPHACPHPGLLRRGNDEGHPRGDRFLLAIWLKRQFLRVSAGHEPARREDQVPCSRGCCDWRSGDRQSASVYVRQALSPIRDLQTLAGRAGIPLVVAFYPSPDALETDRRSPRSQPRQLPGDDRPADGGLPSGSDDDVPPPEIVAAYCRRHGVPFFDPVDSFIRAGNSADLFLHNSPRLAPRGHDLYARELAAFLVGGGLQAAN